MKKLKRMLAYLMVLTLVLGLCPQNVHAEDAEPAATEAAETTEESITTEVATEEEAEPLTEMVEEEPEENTETSEEISTESVEKNEAKENDTEKTEEEPVEEETAEQSAEAPQEQEDILFEDVSNQVLYCTDFVKIYANPAKESNVLKELQPGDEVTVTGRTEKWYRINYEYAESKAAYVEQRNGLFTEDKVDEGAQVLSVERSAADYPSTGTILNSGSWGSGYKWYIKSDNQKHYVFCLDRGSTMYTGYTYIRKSGTIGSSKDNFRITTAMDYFKSKGGWGSESGYADAQWAVWNQGSTNTAKKIIRYANHLWNLTEKNSSRKAGSSSYNGVSGLKQAEISQAYKKDLRSYAYILKDNVISETISVTGSSWKYFAGGAEGWGGISVYGIYDSEGNKLNTSLASASVQTNGSVKVKINNADKYKKEKPVTIVFKADHDYSGSVSQSYLYVDANKQRMGLDADFSSPAYFAMKVYAEPTHPEGAKVAVHKIDEFSRPVPGAKFTLSGTDNEGKQIYNQSLITTGGMDYFEDEITEPGTYYLKEVSSAPGMQNVDKIQGIHIFAKEVTENNVSKIVLSDTPPDGWRDDNPLSGSKKPDYTLTKSADGLVFTYTVTNSYEHGDWRIKKCTNVGIRFENGRFVYEERVLDNVVFELYADEDIYAGDTLLWEADTKITQEVLNRSVWASGGKHNPSMSLTSDSEGKIKVDNFPLGNYYLLEKSNPHADSAAGAIYGIGNERIEFEIDHDYSAVEEFQWEYSQSKNKFFNSPLKGHCSVFKVDRDRVNEDADVEGGENANIPLPGAEFTLYANVNNVNYDGDPFFTAADTVPAVTARDSEGNESIEADKWVPIETAVSDETGLADFQNELPYGEYMAVETCPPEGYVYSEGSSYIFTHRYDEENSYANGAVYTHTFSNVEQANFIITHKTGEILSGTKTVHTENGDYEELQYAQAEAGDIVFEIQDSEGNLVETITTNDQGTAVSSNLKPGTYTVTEKDNKGQWVLDTEPRTVVIEKSLTKAVQNYDVVFSNDLASTKVSIYKKAEVAELSENIPEGKSGSSGVYSYRYIPTSGVVFGVYTENDLKDKKGNAIVKADTCVGYCSTDDNGNAAFMEKLVDGQYYMKEVKAPDERYIIDTSQHAFDILHNGSDINKIVAGDVLNDMMKGSIKVIKTNQDGNIYLKGVKFTLFDSSKKEIGKFVTDKNGEIYIEKLPVGTYYLQETETLKGYKLDDSMKEISLTAGNPDQVIKIKNRYDKTRITVSTKNKITGAGNVRTGDIPLFIFIAVFLLSGFMALFLRRREMKKYLCSISRKKWMLLLCISVAGMGCLTARAAAAFTELSATELKDQAYNGKIYEYAIQKEYETSNPEQKITFDEKTGGYKLSDVQYKILKTVLQKKEVTENRAYKDLLEKDDNKVAQTITQDGTELQLKNIEWSEMDNIEDVSYTRDYGYCTAEPEAPAVHE